MGIRVECDWCRQPIEAGEPYITIEVDGMIGHGAEKPEDASRPARVYHGRTRYQTNDQADCGHWVERDTHWGRPSCAERVLAALDGNPEGRVDMGLEWRLVAQGAPKWEHLIEAPVDALKLKEPVVAALTKAGIKTVRELGRLTEAQWCAIPGIGISRADEIRKALHRHEKVKPKKLADELASLGEVAS